MSIFNFNSPFTIGNPKAGNAHKIEKYKSPWTAATASSTGTFTLPTEWQGKEPDLVWVELLFISSTSGYTAGEIVKANNFQIYDSASPANISYGITVNLDSALTQFEYGIGSSGLVLIDKGTGAQAGISSNVNFRICAERTVIGDQPDITRVGLVPLEKKVVASGDADVQFNLQQYFNEYEDFEISFKNVRCVTDNVSLSMRFAFSGGTFETTNYTFIYSGTSGGAASSGEASAQAYFFLGGNTGTATDFEKRSGKILIQSPSDATNYHWVHVNNFGRSATPSNQVDNRTGYCSNESNEQLTDIQFLASSGNLEEGTFILYGKRKVA